MHLFHSKIIFILSFAIVGLTGCHEKPAGPEARAAAFVKQPKPGAAIKIVSENIVFIKPNEVFTTDILLNLEDKNGELRLGFSASEGLDIMDTPRQINPALDQPNLIKIPVKLRATHNGRFYLNIQANLSTDDGLSSRNLAVIVQVGETVKPPPHFEKQSGEQVISLPAQETITTN